MDQKYDKDHLEFPRHVHKAGVASKIVKDEAEFHDALKDGWSETPPLTDAQKEAVEKAEKVDGAPAKAAKAPVGPPKK